MIPEIGIKYAFDQITNFHIVEVYPEKVRLSQQYMEMEYLLWKSFQTIFPNEDLLISEPCASNNMECILFEKSPSVHYGKYCLFTPVLSAEFKMGHKEFINIEEEYSNRNESYNIAA